MKRFSVTGLMAGVVALAFSGVAVAQSLKEVVVYAVENNPQVISAIKKKDASDSAIDAAKGGFFPKIDLLYGKGRAQNENTSTIAQGIEGFVHLNRKQEGVVLNQMLWDGYGVKSEVDRRGAISASNAYKTYSTVEDIAIQAIDAYLDVLKNRELVAYAKDNLAAHQKSYDQVKLRADKGVGRRADLEQIDARLALATANLEAAEGSLRDADIAYLKVVGKAPVNPTMPAVPQNIPRSVDDAVKAGLEGHSTLKSAQADVDAAQAQRELSRSLISPRLEFEASYSANKNMLGLEGPSNERLAMVWLKWNLFRGGFDYNRLSETGHQINEAQEIARNTNREVEAAVRLAYNAYATARDRLPSLEKYVKFSDATRAAYAQQFSIGQRTLLDLLDSENEFFTARSTYVTARLIEMSARYRVLRAMGQLLTTLDIAPPAQAVVKAPQ